MSTNIDFKALWNNGPNSAAPDASEIYKKADRMKNKMRTKLVLCNIALLFTIGVIAWVWIYDHPKMITTKIGVILEIGAIVFYIVASKGLVQLLFQDDPDNNSNAYIQYLIAIRQKQHLINTRIMTIYYVLLTMGFILYMIEYARMMSLISGIAVYVITLGFLALNWIYSRPRILRKQRGMDLMISKLQEINGQLGE